MKKQCNNICLKIIKDANKFINSVTINDDNKDFISGFKEAIDYFERQYKHNILKNKLMGGID